MKTLLISPGYNKYFAVTPEMFAQLIAAPIYHSKYISGEGEKFQEVIENNNVQIRVIHHSDILPRTPEDTNFAEG